ncbi:hypothetical protein GALMADRAFT_209066 [Galerina marginata CBS 339.88]|uniref:Uncharacterized protein n=1 Tax=Galerina marginata (strain CBS 339.88) TaxID=685588 RepID=A0A067TFF0_GALM3|nr:hypothetical protein GALMADRAFT_209066 [Galerina marginata CBS 339.88]
MTSRNITIDDGNSTLIAFQPPQCNGSGWTVNKSGGYLGSYTSCTSASGPTANVTFTGVAVYYSSPPFEGLSMRFNLDGDLSEDISLSTPSGQTINKTSTRIVWSRSNLTNSQHTLQLLPGSKSSTLNVDALIITQLDAGNTTAPISSPTPPAPMAAPLGAAAAPASSTSTTKLSIGFGVTFGAISFIIFICVTLLLGRRRRELNWMSRNRPKAAAPLHTEQPFGFDSQVGLESQDHYASAPSSPKMDQAPLPMRPLPSVAHGSFTTYDFERERDAEASSSRGWSSPAPSNAHLLPIAGPSSSQSQWDTRSAPLSRQTTFTTKFEPVRRPTGQ